MRSLTYTSPEQRPGEVAFDAARVLLPRAARQPELT